MTEYQFPNAYFTLDDLQADNVGGYAIDPSWWSRTREYVWGFTYAASGQIVGDFGMGWHYRPFHNALSQVCTFTYGVDIHPGILDLPPMQNGVYIVADMSQRIEQIPEASLDRIFCISVLEEVVGWEGALIEFKRLLKPSGLIVLTFDVKYDPEKPEHEKYKGMDLLKFERVAKEIGLTYSGAVSRRKENLLHHKEYNLCVFHAVLKHG